MPFVIQVPELAEIMDYFQMNRNTRRHSLAAESREPAQIAAARRGC
jgi:hypothetical protein